MRISKTAVLTAIVLASICLRIWTFSSVNRLLPLKGLYVDEVTYSRSPFVPGVEGFSRPPAMFIAAMLMNVSHNTAASRIAITILSMLPALALYLTFRKKGGIWLYVCTAGLALSPFMVLYGIQIMPAIPAAALVSFTLLLANRKKTALAGFLAGIAILFRAELVLVPIFLLAFTYRSHFRKWMIFTGFTAIAVVPVIVLNLLAGAGPVIASNGGENLWFGTSWELVTTPPGTEFEQLVSTGDSQSGGDSVFLDRAFNSITQTPVEWLKMGGSKVLAFFTLPGPGRNFETGWMLQKTWLFILLPLTLLAMSVGLTAGFGRKKNFWQLIAVAIICSGIASAFIFFPSARFRTAILPAFWFLAASITPDWKILRTALAPAAGIIIISLFVTYPGKERSGLTSMLSAEHFLDSGELTESAEYLKDAEERGYYGADFHNVKAVLFSLSGYTERGLNEFEKALEIAPNSPTLWKNYAISLWANDRHGNSIEAARRAILLNPLLRDELMPILEHAENH
ncbi:MAG: hypothetical protein K8S15_09215 [Candidatus Aegiribacteria sp.]|nr:hypothetical protein [Candidatus Aegiribacteria sp.]